MFGDAGIINKNTVKEALQFDKLRADAGVGMGLTIKKFGPLEKVSPLSLFFDVPLFLNTPPGAEPEYIKFRWIAGVRTNF
jgi:aminopeptidase N